MDYYINNLKVHVGLFITDFLKLLFMMFFYFFKILRYHLNLLYLQIFILLLNLIYLNCKLNYLPSVLIADCHHQILQYLCFQYYWIILLVLISWFNLQCHLLLNKTILNGSYKCCAFLAFNFSYARLLIFWN